MQFNIAGMFLNVEPRFGIGLDKVLHQETQVEEVELQKMVIQMVLLTVEMEHQIQ